jgi:hypothetical protein
MRSLDLEIESLKSVLSMDFATRKPLYLKFFALVLSYCIVIPDT